MPANDYTRIREQHVCPSQPVAAGMRLSYPWADVEPGGMFIVLDPSPQARSRLSAGATAAGKRLGRRFATGMMRDETDTHVGWWAIRVDGVTYIDPEPQSSHGKWQQATADRLENERRRQRGERVHRRAPIEPVRPLGTADAPYLTPEVEPVDMTAVQAEWAASPMPEVGAASEGEAF